MSDGLRCASTRPAPPRVRAAACSAWTACWGAGCAERRLRSRGTPRTETASSSGSDPGARKSAAGTAAATPAEAGGRPETPSGDPGCRRRAVQGCTCWLCARSC
uniref:Putative secreted protein n=1 Tax=Ixodes ricinus TaxID=34613 RepID=A0A6B0UFQ6_IXORI